MTGHEEAGRAPVGGLGRLISHQALSALVATAGAAAALFALVLDHFVMGGAQGFGQRQILMTAFGAVAVLGALGLEVAAGRTTMGQALRFAAVVGQVGLLTLAFRVYQIENTAFSVVLSALMLCGFVVHHFLPARLRLPFFVCLAVAGLYGVIGVGSPKAFVGVVGIGLGLIGICHLPIAMWGRVAILLAAMAALAAARLDAFKVGWLTMSVPIVASMFMFRLGIYLYDISNKKGPTDPWHRLAYFFLPPNVAFPFFPVIDFATFGRTYYDQEAVRIYQRGAIWMLRGLAHLLLYRVVNYYFTLAPADVVDPATFLQFLTANFGLYLKISGLFHLIIGSLLLFGFNLPETHTRFYFSNSFVDFWRRINIYWKDFMQKCVFNPSFMFLKQRGAPVTTSIVLSMFVVFFATWALHAYNWFWLRGTVLLVPQDMMFWGVLALFLVTQTLLEERRNSLRKPGAPPGRTLLGPRASLVVRTVCTMLTICNLWALWTSSSLAEWALLWTRSGLLPAFVSGQAHDALAWTQTLATLTVALIMTAIATGVSFGLVSQTAPKTVRRRPAKVQSARDFYLPLLAGAAIVVALTVIQAPAAILPLGDGVRQVAENIRESRLNAHDQATLERGYYEGLTNNMARSNSELWNALMLRPHASEIRNFPGVRMRPDFLEYEFAPMTSSYFNEVRYDINRWGMRDKDYALTKPPGVFRIAMVGASREIGWGVNYEDRFETLLEDRLNAEHAGDTGQRFEILNFSIDGYLPFQRLFVLDNKVWQFEPDLVIYAAGSRDLMVDDLVRMVREGYPAPYPFVEALVRQNKISRQMSDEEIQAILSEHKYELLDGAYRHFATSVKQHAALPIWLYFPNVEKYPEPASIAKMRQTGRNSGAIIMDLADVFAGHDIAKLWVAPMDNHPNPAGHRLIADAVYQRLIDLETQGRIHLRSDAADQAVD